MMKIKYPEIGVCGLSCKLCPNYHTEGESRCGGCKSEGRMKVGCSFITCAVKKKGVEFCWQCKEHENCEKWSIRRKWGQSHDSFVCYQRLEENIASVKRSGLAAFVRDQKAREQLLTATLTEFNEGRSKSYYCVAATVMDLQEMVQAITQARNETAGMDMKGKSRALHLIIDAVAEKKRYKLKLRK
jgi:hypothetical protein